MSKTEPRRADVAIGQVILDIRNEQRLRRDTVARRLGISSQQLHKYEVASNRISVSRLFDLAKALGMHPAMLVAMAMARMEATSGARATTTDMVAAIADPKIRKAVEDLMRSLGEERSGG
jgi:transcriptional regulator with XRE-family HTH domain